MPGSPGTLAAPELPAGGRFALVVATTGYADAELAQLRAPGEDAVALSHVLSDPAVGGFAVASVIDATAQQLRIAVEDFVRERAPGDLLLLYLSCHGVVDGRRRLYFAAADTVKARLASTGVESQWVLDQLDECRARRQVVVLDCCFSGAFAHGAKGDHDLGLGERFHSDGRGRVVLTASRSTEYSFEGDPVDSSLVGSVFTAALVDGIRTGGADVDRDGLISVEEAYAYAYGRVQATGVPQTPQRWLYGGEGDIVLARSPAGIPVTPEPIPASVRDALDSGYPGIRLGAVGTLAEWLASGVPGRIVAARDALAEVAEHDQPAVAAEARRLLAEGTSPRSGPAASASTAGTSTGDASAAVMPASGSDRPAAGSATTSRTRTVTIVAGIVVVAVAAAATIGALVLRGQAGSGNGTAPPATEFTAEAPWRLLVRDQRSGDDTGCSITVVDARDGSTATAIPSIYGNKAFQMAVGGDYRVSVDAPGCLVVHRAGAGALRPPFAALAGRGDTDAFPGDAAVTVAAKGMSAGTSCDLQLHDAATGQLVDFATLDDAHPTVSLAAQGHSDVYLADLGCDVDVSLS